MAAEAPLSIYGQGSRGRIDTWMELLCLLMVCVVLRHLAVMDAGSARCLPEGGILVLRIVRGRSQPEGASLGLEIRVEEGLVEDRCSCMA